MMMRSLFIGIMLIGISFSMTGYAEETGTAVLEGTGSTEDTDIVSASLNESFSQVEAAILLSSEEAFGYLLTNNTSEKQEYYKQISKIENIFASFEEAAETSGNSQPYFSDAYDSIRLEYGNMTSAADLMFYSFESTGKPVPKDVERYESSLDTLIDTAGKTWDIHDTGDDGPSTVEGTYRLLAKVLLSAAEESYAYPVTGNVTEKEDALADFTRFDTDVAAFEDKFPDGSYGDLKQRKDGMMKAAEVMFATYEKEGSADKAEVAALESVIEELDSRYQELVDK